MISWMRNEMREVELGEGGGGRRREEEVERGVGVRVARADVYFC